MRRLLVLRLCSCLKRKRIASAEVIFGYDEFTKMADFYKPSMDAPLGLNATFGAPDTPH